MASIIQNQFNQILGDGARASKFEIQLVFNNAFSEDLDSREEMFLAKTSSFPGKTHEVIGLKYKGRSIPIKGQTKYSQVWDCTFYMSHDHKLKNIFETWIESIDQQHNYFDSISDMKNLAAAQAINSDRYVTNILLKQQNFDGDQTTAVYELFNAFPIGVSTVEMNSESVGAITEFTVSFSYSHYKSENVPGGNDNFIDSLVDKFKDGVSDIFLSLIHI